MNTLQMIEESLDETNVVHCRGVQDTRKCTKDETNGTQDNRMTSVHNNVHKCQEPVIRRPYCIPPGLHFTTTSHETMKLAMTKTSNRNMEGWKPRRLTTSERLVIPLINPAKAQSKIGVATMHSQPNWACKNSKAENSLRIEFPSAEHTLKRLAT